ncbi:HNH endonuclease [Ruminiclostridium josui]|uniref:HNH endonuclease n=1 Tax=Ruminiclostridium josui TaxID=1499 RepID=UPI000466E05A|nr:HNH endonuclease [Ruminiclostridium josui]
MTQREAQIRNIRALMSWNREYFPNGVALTNGKDGLFYSYTNGAITRLRLNKDNKWSFWGNGVGRLVRDYLQFQLPGSRINIYNHVVAAVALGLFDNANIKDAYINHKNYNGCDNRPNNLEICTNSENTLHGQFRVYCINLGIWTEGISIEAKEAIRFLRSLKEIEP